MENLKENVLKLFAGNKRARTVSQIENELNIKTSGEIIMLSRALEQLEDQYELVRMKDNSYKLASDAGFLEGRVQVSKKGTGFIDRDSQPSILIAPEDLGDALNGDLVFVRLSNTGEYARVIEVREHAIHQVTGTFREVGRGLKCVPDDERIANHEYSVTYGKDLKVFDGLRVLLKIVKYGKFLKLEVEKVLGHKDDPGVDILSVLYDHEIDPEFPEEVMAEANAAPDTVLEEELEGRVDLRNEVFITIDGDSSKDFDDAVSVTKNDTGWNLKVSIADVSHYVKDGSPLDAEALNRGTSTYICDTVVPMLPHVLSNGICSLNPHVDRLTMTCDMNIAKDGSIDSYKVYPSVICSTERMTYNNVNDMLDGDRSLCEKYAHILTLINDLTDCADAIRSERHRKGAIDFDTTESEIVCNENGYPVDIHARTRGHAEEVIEDCMIAANVCVADFVKERGIPALYRVHGEPEARRMKNFEETSVLLGQRLYLPDDSVSPKDLQKYLERVKDTTAYPVLANLLLRCMQKAAYDANCIGHFGLAEQKYLHFTSPIRRYPDLVVHRMIRKYAFEKCEDRQQLAKDAEKMKEYASETSMKERRSIEAERDAEDMKKAEYMQGFIGKKMDGIITGVTNYGFYVQLENTVEGLVAIATLEDDYYSYDSQMHAMVGQKRGNQYTLGMKVSVIVEGASKDAGTVDFRLASGRKTQRNNRTNTPNDRKRYTTRSRSSKAENRRGSTGRSGNRNETRTSGENGRGRRSDSDRRSSTGRSDSRRNQSGGRKHSGSSRSTGGVKRREGRGRKDGNRGRRK